MDRVRVPNCDLQSGSASLMEEEMEGEEAIHIVVQMDTHGYRMTHGLCGW